MPNEPNGNETPVSMLDKLAYTDAESLLNCCIAAKNRNTKTTGQAYLNTAKTRSELPPRPRRKKS